MASLRYVGTYRINIRDCVCFIGIYYFYYKGLFNFNCFRFLFRDALIVDVNCGGPSVNYVTTRRICILLGSISENIS